MKGTRTNIDVGGVLHTGRELAVREAVLLPEFASYSFPAPVDVRLKVSRLGRGLDLQGTIDGVAEGECARCLDDVRLPLHLELHETLEPAGERDLPLGESNVFSGEELDVRDLVRQLIDSALPIVLLCSEDCPGLCSDCGHKRDDACRCTHPE
jgi:uncharacterized protein